MFPQYYAMFSRFFRLNDGFNDLCASVNMGATVKLSVISCDMSVNLDIAISVNTANMSWQY